MIDIIVIDYGKDLIKTLASIYIQTISDRVTVYLIGKEKNNEVDGFKERILIKEYYGKNIDKMKKEVLTESTGNFIYTMYSGDVFYDTFALNNVIKCVDNGDAVISRVVNRNVGYVDFVDRGNLYRRSYLINKEILDLNYEKMFLLSGGIYAYANDCIYVYSSKDNNKNIIADTIKMVDEGYRRTYSLECISNTIYDVVLYMAYYYSDKKKIDMSNLKKYYDIYKKYISPECSQFYSKFYHDNMESDCKLIKELFVK